MNYAVIAFAVFSLPVLIFGNQVSFLLAPGFSVEEQQMMTNFTRVMIVFQVFPLMLGNFLTGMLQSYQLFLIPALAPIVYNIGTIVGIIFLAPIFGLWAPVIGGRAIFNSDSCPHAFTICTFFQFEKRSGWSSRSGKINDSKDNWIRCISN
jgi:peptidoglycan biosynthesis protein MviN/MurJ (putative lipid II flippase)